MNNHIPIPPPKIILRRIRKTIKANFATGILTWKNPLSRRMKPGDVAGSLYNGYIRVGFRLPDGQLYNIMAHHIIWYLYYGEWPTKQLDHKDTIKHHNWIDNLRPASDRQQAQNKGLRAHNTSGITGVYWSEDHNKWRVVITGRDGKRIHRGYFASRKIAKRVRRQAERKYFGQFRYMG